MASLKYILKEMTGGQLLSRKERLIFLWWGLSLFSAMAFAESLPLLFIAVGSFILSSKFLDKIPISKFPMDDAEI